MTLALTKTIFTKVKINSCLGYMTFRFLQKKTFCAIGITVTEDFEVTFNYVLFEALMLIVIIFNEGIFCESEHKPFGGIGSCRTNLKRADII